jgi:hypothetical protein
MISNGDTVQSPRPEFKDDLRGIHCVEAKLGFGGGFGFSFGGSGDTLLNYPSYRSGDAHLIVGPIPVILIQIPIHSSSDQSGWTFR